MIYLVHGDDVVKSRTLIVNQQKKLNIEKRVELDLSEITPQKLLEFAASTDLFGNAPLIVINISSAKKEKLEATSALLAKLNPSATIIFLAEKELPATHPLKNTLAAQKATIVLNNLVPEENVFKFVDALFSKKRKEAYQEYQKLLASETDFFYIFSMILYGLRNIAFVVLKSPLADKINPYVKSKSQAQAKTYLPEQINLVFEQMYELEKKAKTGGIATDLLIPCAMEKVLNS